MQKLFQVIFRCTEPNYDISHLDIFASMQGRYPEECNFKIEFTFDRRALEWTGNCRCPPRRTKPLCRSCQYGNSYLTEWKIDFLITDVQQRVKKNFEENCWYQEILFGMQGLYKVLIIQYFVDKSSKKVPSLSNKNAYFIFWPWKYLRKIHEKVWKKLAFTVREKMWVKGWCIWIWDLSACKNANFFWKYLPGFCGYFHTR